MVDLIIFQNRLRIEINDGLLLLCKLTFHRNDLIPIEYDLFVFMYELLTELINFVLFGLNDLFQLIDLISSGIYLFLHVFVT
jgi:hypothetical protein